MGGEQAKCDRQSLSRSSCVRTVIRSCCSKLMTTSGQRSPPAGGCAGGYGGQ
jgi:hypothetical protein